jgi:uncharacterized membrane protein
MNESDLEFNRGVVRPVECLREGWRLIKNDYWLFLGICFVGAFIGQAAPLGLLAGPMMCGIEICMLRRMRGLPVTFDKLFRGFDYFVPSLVAHLVSLGLMLPLIILFYIGFGASFLIFIPAAQNDGPPDPIFIWAFVGAQAVLTVVFMTAIMIVATLFLFAYPLIVDRELPAMQAIRTSARAVWANFGGMMGLILLFTLMSLAGVLACYVGAILVMPIGYAAIAVAYRQVFPAEASESPEEELPDGYPPPVVAAGGDAIQGVADPAEPPAPVHGNGLPSTGIQGDPTRQGP